MGGDDPDWRRRDFCGEFRRGETRCWSTAWCSPKAVTNPGVDCMIMARPTQSRSLYQQMIGAAAPPHPGKRDCLIVDVVGVSAKHTLQTAAFLFDCDAKQLAENALTEVKAEQLRAQRPAPAAMEGPLHSTPVDLFARRVLRWVQTRQGAWVLSLGEHGTMRLQPDGEGTWARRCSNAAPLRPLLPTTCPWTMPRALPRRWRATWNGQRLVSAEAPWRSHPASARQTELLKRFGIAIQAGLTKGEAADQISAVMGDWD